MFRRTFLKITAALLALPLTRVAFSAVRVQPEPTVVYKGGVEHSWGYVYTDDADARRYGGYSPVSTVEHFVCRYTAISETETLVEEYFYGKEPSEQRLSKVESEFNDAYKLTYDALAKTRPPDNSITYKHAPSKGLRDIVREASLPKYLHLG